MTEKNHKPTWVDESSSALSSKLIGIPSLAEALKSIPYETIRLGEAALEKQIRAERDDGAFDRTLGMLKISFWKEYDRSVEMKDLMVMDNIVHGICHREFLRKTIANKAKCAWLMTPPIHESILQQEIITLGLKKLREVFDHTLIEVEWKNVKNKKGETLLKKTRTVNVALLKEMHSIVKTFQDRVHGSVVHRQQIATHSVKEHRGTKGDNIIDLDDPTLSLADLNRYEEKLSTVSDNIKEGEIILDGTDSGGEASEA